ncbi:MAG TPA: SHOCT domain-containing protein [Opitutaceae bacterium]|nr:SHOCT domain-containing protein [Opitutaceae bacterium]
MFVLGALGLTLAGCAGTSQTTASADGSFTLVRQAGTGFDRDSDVLKEQVRQDAEKFCAARGKQLKIVSLTAEKPLYLTGYVSAKIVFQALDAADPRLREPAAGPAPMAAPGGATAVAPAATIPNDLYTQLLQLDDLRKRGILTEEEFQAEKKKVLARSH